jgi:glucosamine--fructose-6-phosphate aminotransferase (isomerizing)
MAACETGALITKESTRSPAEAMSSAAFRHGPLELAGPETMVLVMEGDANARALNTKLVRDIHDRGGRAELIGPSAEIGALRVLGGLNRLLPMLDSSQAVSCMQQKSPPKSKNEARTPIR